MRCPKNIVMMTGLLSFVGIQPSHAQVGSSPDLRLSVVGVGTQNYADSLNFYTKVMGLRPAFSFSPNGKTTFTYLQMSKDTFLELQENPTNAPGLTHIHMQTRDADAIIARLRKAGVATCSDSVKVSCTVDSRIAGPTKEKNAVIVDPNGIRIEPTEFTPGSLTKNAFDTWDSAAVPTKADATRLMVVGIAVKDYAESEAFYEKSVGFPVAFKFTSPDGQRTTKYYQISKDSFLEMQLATAAMPVGLTHVHIVTGNLNAMVARLHQAGLASAARTATTPNTVTEAGVTQPSNVKSANVFDPNGIRLELNELLPESLTKKAMDSWK
jgi:catechol 2,3-dioxygenase-like lactoylglutathione lyase family enzyme